MKSRGGKREGAGRKRGERTSVIYARVQPHIAERIKKEAEEQGVSVGAIVEQCFQEEFE